MSELSKRMRNLRDAARLRPLRISSAYDGGMTVAMMRAKLAGMDRSDSTLYRAIADDPNAYPDSDRGP